VHIGNFVEVKNSTVADRSKANHLAYVGDATVGSNVNVGAGTITCNYDGANKHRTVIEDDVFIGSDTQLVAPVTVGRGATLGAGTTLTEDAPPDKLTITRVKQTTVPGWKRPVKKKFPRMCGMCGIVAAVADRNIVPILIEGLRKLEYRGYDSAGLAVHQRRHAPPARRRPRGRAGRPRRWPHRRHRHRPHALGHPRRALRAQRPPHVSGGLAVVHNGIIENFEEIKARLPASATPSPPRPTPRSSPTSSSTS
jgi:hypothetical protein